MRKITFYLMLLFSFSNIQAQLFEVPLCNGNIASNTYGPMNSVGTANATNRTAVIYPSSQLATLAGQELNGLYFKRVTAAGVMSGSPVFRVYLKETSATDFGTTGLDWATEIATATLVYGDDPTAAVGSTAGWKNFILSTNFTYTGTQNLAVYMEYVNTAASTTIGWEYEYSAPCVTTTNSNTTKYINNTTGTPGATLTSTNYRRPQIAFDFVVSCPAPTGFAASNINTTTVDLNWTAGGSEMEWEYAVLLATDPAPTSGTSTMTNSVIGATVLPATNYKAYVRAVCGVGDNSVWKSISFTTPCASYTPSYSENFATFPPNCWTRAAAGDPTTGPTGTAAGIWLADGFLNAGTTGAIKVNLYGTARIGWIISPTIDMSAGNYRVKFDYAVTTWNQTTSSAMGSDDVVQLVVSEDGGTTWQVLTTFNAASNVSNALNTFTLSLNAYTNPNTKFALYATDGTVDDTQDYDFFIDNFIIEPIPSCVETSTPVAANLTATSVDVSWTAGGAEMEWEYVLALATDPAPTTGTSTMSSSVTALTVTPNTAYTFYVRAVCGVGNTSPWKTLNFTSLCDVANVPYSMNFESAVVPAIPNCTSVVNAGTGNLWTTVNNPGSGFTTKTLRYAYNGTNAANTWFFTQALNLVGGTSYRISYDYGNNSTTYVESLKVSYGTSASAAAMTDMIMDHPTINTNTLQNSIVDFTPTTSGVYYIGFQAYSIADQFNLYVDNILVDVSPALAPDCPSNATATQQATCGNFPITFAWDAVSGANSYNLTIGTTSGGNDILDNVSQGTSTSYTLTTPMLNQAYYYTVTATNNIGTSTACVENTFTTPATGCYCVSVPTSNDGIGVTNVTVNTTSYTTTDVTYQQLSTPIADISRGIGNSMSVTISTDDGFSSYDYDHNVWIDFNDNYVFEPSELVVSGVSAAASPTTLSLTFTPGATVPLGNHTMRIGNADSGQATPNPCYNGNYGNTIDLIVNVVDASCSPVTYSTATIVPNCANNQYSIDVVVTGLGDATMPALSDGVNTYPIMAAGTITAGPFANGSSVSLTISHQDNTCSVNLGSFTYTCPPANDDCTGAVALTAGGVYGDFLTDGTNVAATDSTDPDPTTCNGYSGGDVWYSVTVPDSGSITIETGNSSTGDTGLDTVFTVYTGSCGALTQIGCDDDGAATGAYSFLSLTGQTAGSTLYIRVYEYNNDSSGRFGISAYDGSLDNSSFDNSNFTYYPNPVKNVLNLSYSQNISQVEVYNLVGQKMSSNSFNVNNVEVDMSGYPTGVYLVNITSNNATKTVRVIKE